MQVRQTYLQTNLKISYCTREIFLNMSITVIVVVIVTIIIIIFIIIIYRMDSNLLKEFKIN